MTAKAISDEKFVELFRAHGAAKAAAMIGVGERAIYRRRRNLERYFQPLDAPTKAPTKEYAHRATMDIKNGAVLIGSDFHIWPGAESTALRAFKKFAADLKPAAVILNGDVLDFPQVSKHASIGWESVPALKDELEAAQDHLADIVSNCGRGTRKIWTLGNHDARFETMIANSTPQYKGIKGVHLSDHFPIWEKGWSTWINNEVVVKHRWKGGVHATHNNAAGSGKTMVTGHLHSQKVTPYTDYNGTRYGVDTGCVAETDHTAFINYTEDAPLNWRSGFAVLTFKDGRLMYPELVSVWSDKAVQFRGQLIRV